MKLIDRSYPNVERNLRLDLELLDSSSHDVHDSFLRFWEPSEFCVVLGKSRKAEMDVQRGFCEHDGVQICRRESGGGTVVLGPGCLCYSLVLSLTPANEKDRGLPNRNH